MVEKKGTGFFKGDEPSPEKLPIPFLYPFASDGSLLLSINGSVILSGEIQLNRTRTKNLECISLPCSRYLWLKTYSRPCPVECGVLLKPCFVFEEDGRPFALGFF